MLKLNHPINKYSTRTWNRTKRIAMLFNEAWPVNGLISFQQPKLSLNIIFEVIKFFERQERERFCNKRHTNKTSHSLS